jgi:excisionase family DNA binding protein
MEKMSSGEKVTVQVAARTLGVSKGTVVHYLNNGKLTRIKEGSTVYISLDEIRGLMDMQADQDEDISTSPKNPAEPKVATDPGIRVPADDEIQISVDRAHYEELLTRLGQLEVKNRNLLAYKDTIVKTKVNLNEREKELQKVKAKLRMMEEELRRLKKMGWWKRVFGRKWRMTGG